MVPTTIVGNYGRHLQQQRRQQYIMYSNQMSKNDYSVILYTAATKVGKVEKKILEATGDGRQDDGTRHSYQYLRRQSCWYSLRQVLAVWVVHDG